MTLMLPTLRTDRQKGMDRLLFARFREEAGTPEVKRVEKILSLLVFANSHLENWRHEITTRIRGEFLEEVRKRNASKNSYLSTLDQLGEVLERYQWRSEIVGGIEGFNEELAWSNKITDEMSNWEHGVVRILLGLTNVPGEIARLRHCTDCQNWFYAASAHQQFCGDSCRRRHTANSAVFKEKRRLYMQQTYRPQQKQRELESHEAARRVAAKGRKGK